MRSGRPAKKTAATDTPLQALEAAAAALADAVRCQEDCGLAAAEAAFDAALNAYLGSISVPAGVRKALAQYHKRLRRCRGCG